MTFVRRHPVLLIWAAWSITFLVLSWGAVVTLHPQDPDDYLRLMEVRDLLAGQSWWDVTQYRMNPPAGGAMHWSRLVDVPIAAALWLARLVVAEPGASEAASTIVPLGQLLLVMGVVWHWIAALGGDRAQRLIAVIIVPLFPLLFSSFLPLRIDHHGWQAIAALGCAYFLARAPERRAALLSGVIAALWLSISLEGLPLVVVFAALYALRHLLFRERSLAWFLTGLAGMSVVAHLATRPSSELLPHCDTIGWPHLAAFTAAALLAHATGALGRSSIVIRAATLALIGAVAGALIVVPVGACAINPFDGLDPVMERYWHGVVREGLPITVQLMSIRLVMLWTLLIPIVALLAGLPDRVQPLAERRWLWLLLLVFAATPVGLLVMRESVNVEMLTVPFSALLIARYLPRVRAIRLTLPRALATALLPLVATPALASVLGKPLDTWVRSPRVAVTGASAPVTSAGGDDACDLTPLAALPPSRLFATLDLGPEILVRTRHSVVASGYHRNMAKMREVVEAFSGDPGRAEAIVRRDGARYVVLCASDGDTAVFRGRRADGLANQLANGAVPAWLAPVPALGAGPLLVFEVR